MQIALWCVSAYLVVGIGVTIWLYEPESDGWLWQILIWPLTLAGMLIS